MNDIESVLHLYLGCDAQVTASEYYGSGIGRLVSIDIEGCVCVVSANTPNDRTKYCVEADLSDVKPILSRLSDMTEDDRACFGWQDDSDFKEISEGQTLKNLYHAWMFPELLSKGYWLFGDEAFDSGIIIDKKTWTNS